MHLWMGCAGEGNVELWDRLLCTPSHGVMGYSLSLGAGFSLELALTANWRNERTRARLTDKWAAQVLPGKWFQISPLPSLEHGLEHRIWANVLTVKLQGQSYLSFLSQWTFNSSDHRRRELPTGERKLCLHVADSLEVTVFPGDVGHQSYSSSPSPGFSVTVTSFITSTGYAQHHSST